MKYGYSIKFKMFLKVPVIIMRVGENNVLCLKYNHIYNIFWGREGVTWPTLHFCLLFIKTEKLQDHDQYLNQIIHHFDLKNFSLG